MLYFLQPDFLRGFLIFKDFQLDFNIFFKIINSYDKKIFNILYTKQADVTV